MSCLEVAGHRYGRLFVLDDAGRNKHGQRLVRCRCDCGVETVKLLMTLRKGMTKSCGCFRRECGIARTSPGGAMDGLKHGRHNTSEYRTWHGMKDRCLNPASASFPFYGGRGIVVCKRWRESFENFFADMGARPSPDHTIDRKRNGGPYSPSNCRWATRTQQQRNTRYNRMITIAGKTRCVAEWAELSGLSWSLIYNRWYMGWKGERLLLPSNRLVPG